MGFSGIKIGFLGCIVLFSSVLGTALVGAETVDRIAARVNDEIILLSDIRIRITQLKGMQALMKMDRQKIKEMEKKLLEEMIEEKMFIQYAHQQHIIIDESEIERSIQNLKKENNLSEEQLKQALKREGITIEEYKEFLIGQRLLSIVVGQEVSSKVFIDKAELEKYYKGHISDFMSEEQVRVRHILLMAGKDDSAEKRKRALQKAEDILTRVKNGENFEKLAELYSEDGSASIGGDLGFFGKGKMIKEFEDVAFSLKPGDVSGVVPTSFGYHLIKCEEKKRSEPMAFDKAEVIINKKLFSERAEERRKEFVENLKKVSIIERRI